MLQVEEGGEATNEGNRGRREGGTNERKKASISLSFFRLPPPSSYFPIEARPVAVRSLREDRLSKRGKESKEGKGRFLRVRKLTFGAGVKGLSAVSETGIAVLS